MEKKKRGDKTICCCLDLLKALGDEARFEIVSLLASGDKCVCQIFGHLDLPQNLVSHHLKVLRQAGLVANHKDGKWVHYSLNKNKVKELRDIAAKILAIPKIK